MSIKFNLQKIILFCLLITPFLQLVFMLLSGDMIDPIEEITNPTGEWALRLLLLSLLITPLNKLLPFNIIKYRRMVGVFCFFYACVHFSIWLIDQGLNVQTIVADIIKRPYVTLGFSAFVVLFLLAITSTNKMMRRLGKNWKKLHKFSYLITVLVITHFYLQVKSITDIEPLIYAIIAILLLGYRVKIKFSKK